MYNKYNQRHRTRPAFRPRRRFEQASFHPSAYINEAQQPNQPEEPGQNVSIDTLNIDPQLMQNIIKKGYKMLTPIQEKAIPVIMEGKDVVGVANTGTGKTAAFLIPLLHKLSKNKNQRILIILPTRELAMQIRDELHDFTLGMGIYGTLAMGGVPIRAQIHELRRNPHIVIGTPGRLKDLIERKSLNLSGFGSIVLDEVDRMLDMGFIHDIRALIAMLPKERHSLFFSATLSREIQGLIQSFAPNNVMISVKTRQGTGHIDQNVVKVAGGQKMEKLNELLRQEEFKKVLIFVRTKFGAERLAKDLYAKGFETASIHGNKSQQQRTRAIHMFQENRINILVATDVASRGIDIDDITHVINYDQPATREDYIHRIGRTGRANKKGSALTFVE